MGKRKKKNNEVASFQIYIFRYSFDRFSDLKGLAHELEGKTKYVRMAPLEEAPEKMDCNSCPLSV